MADRTPAFAELADALDEIDRRLRRTLAGASETLARRAEAIRRRAADVGETEAWRIAALLTGERGAAHDGAQLARRDLDHDAHFGEPVSASIFFLPRTHWKVVVVTPKSLVTARADAIVRLFSAVALALSVLAVGVGWILIRRGVVRPIHDMVGQLQRRAAEGTAGPIDEPCAPIELAVLARAFNERTEQLVRAREAAEVANAAKSEFLANMSHEIRTPLTAILGYVEFLSDDDLPAEERRRSVRVIRDNGEHLLQVINDILDISKLESGAIAIERVEVSLWEIVESIRSLMAVRCAAKDLDLLVDLVPPLPRVVRTDPLRLKQVLFNLVGNAVKFTDRGSVTLRVRHETTGPGAARIRFDVIDTGIGIERELLETIFEPFRQADSSTTREFGGTGLGLCISRRLVRLLGGEIEVDSTPGAGSRFSFTIDPGPLEGVPMVDRAPAPDRPATSCEDGDEATPGGLRGRVLVVEDVAVNRGLLVRMLRRAGLDVDEARHGGEAVARIRSAVDGHGYDVVLMDMQMPVMDGYEATRRLRAEGYRGAIIACTAHAMEGDRDACLAAGCDAVATKPIDRAALLALLAQALGAGTAAS